MSNYSKYGFDHEPKFVWLWVSFVDEGGDHDNAFYTAIKTDNSFVEEEDELIFFYGLSLDDIEYGYENGTVFEGEWIITGIDYVTDSIV